MVCAFSFHVLIWIAYYDGKGIIQEGSAGQLHTNSVFCTHFWENRDRKEKVCTKMLLIIIYNLYYAAVEEFSSTAR